MRIGLVHLPNNEWINLPFETKNEILSPGRYYVAFMAVD